MAKPAERSAARLAAVQALTRWTWRARASSTRSPSSRRSGSAARSRASSFKPAENAFFRDILAGVVREQRAVDGKVDAALAAAWPLTRIEAVLRAILRAGAYELMFRPDVPVRAAISEYVDVAHSFYGGDEPGLVNAVLDAVAREVRGGELKSRA